jgi:hypothetical protein
VPRTLNRLNARKVTTLTKLGRHADGGNLYLVISPGAGRSWVFMYRWQGRQIELGLGSANAVSLARARLLAARCREEIAAGINPQDARKPKAKLKTFAEVAEEVADSAKWRNDRHDGQWRKMLSDHAESLGAMRVTDVDTEVVLSALRPIWATTYVSAQLMRGRIERVLDAAKAKGLRTGESPARWKGHLDQLLPRRSKAEIEHHAAMPYAELPTFMARSEFDLEAGLWTVPVHRMKGGPVCCPNRRGRLPL